MLLILKKEQIEFARLRVLAQSIINREKGPEVYDEFRKAAFPWVETQKNRDRQAHIKILQDEIKRGVLGIQPLWENNKQIRSRLKTKVVDASTVPDAARRRSTNEERKIYEKMGALVPR
jgi:hypothetical protein